MDLIVLILRFPHVFEGFLEILGLGSDIVFL